MHHLSSWVVHVSPQETCNAVQNLRTSSLATVSTPALTLAKLSEPEKAVARGASRTKLASPCEDQVGMSGQPQSSSVSIVDVIAGSEASSGETSTGGVQLARAFARKSSKPPGGTVPAAGVKLSVDHGPSAEPTEDGEAVAKEAIRFGFIDGPSEMAGKPHIRLVKTPTPPSLWKADLRCCKQNKTLRQSKARSLSKGFVRLTRLMKVIVRHIRAERRKFIVKRSSGSSGSDCAKLIVWRPATLRSLSRIKHVNVRSSRSYSLIRSLAVVVPHELK